MKIKFKVRARAEVEARTAQAKSPTTPAEAPSAPEPLTTTCNTCNAVVQCPPSNKANLKSHQARKQYMAAKESKSGFSPSLGPSSHCLVSGQSPNQYWGQISGA